MRHRFHAEQWVPYSRTVVFAFFADPANLPPLMPGWQHTRTEKIELVAPAQTLRSTSGVVAGNGSRITISFRPIPLISFRLGWEAYIDEFRWEEFFCDVQQHGPFRYFRHCHHIRDGVREAVTGCVVSDAVEYELPLGLLGDLANALIVKWQIRSLFAHRQTRLLQMLGNPRP